MKIGGVFWYVKRANVLATFIEYPKAFRATDPDIAELVTFHAIRDAAFHLAVTDVLRKALAVAETSVTTDLVDINKSSGGIGDVHQ